MVRSFELLFRRIVNRSEVKYKMLQNGFPCLVVGRRKIYYGHQTMSCESFLECVIAGDESVEPITTERGMQIIFEVKFQLRYYKTDIGVYATESVRQRSTSSTLSEKSKEISNLSFDYGSWCEKSFLYMHVPLVDTIE